MDVKIQVPEGKEALTEFVRFHDQLYAYRDARWPAPLTFQLSILTGESPFAQERKIRPFIAWRGSDIVGRAVAVVDEHYNRHWHERLGHISLFEALPENRAATKLLLDAACDWLKAQGTKAARAGWGLMDRPFVIDDYDSLPPSILRQNPAYYHRLFKEAGFEVEKGWVDYKIEVQPELVARWENALEGPRRAGYEIVPLKDVPASRRVTEFTDTWNDTFKVHWGWTPFTEEEIACLFEMAAPAGLFETSVLAYRAGTPVGMLYVIPEGTARAVLKPGCVVQEAEKLNVLGIGVREAARGQGVNLAMAAYAYLELARRGATYLSYTLVYDDNWPSRRTAEKLGAFVCANYLVYRRNFRR